MLTRDKNKQTKNMTLFRLQPAQATIPTILGMVIEEVRTSFAPLPLTYSIRSVVLPLVAIENGRENAPPLKNAYNLVDCPPKATKLKS